MDKDNNYVTHEECEKYRENFIEENRRLNADIAAMRGDIRAMTEQIKNLVNQNKWFLGIAATAIGGVLVWLVTRV